ncbi:MAG: 3-hydroxyacyl-CoA dehydrogenase [Alphaproteobacteria bacterium]|nr:3-hydroxyacyl-CoA dehydrogenase [Alphaproteobacteria bacterium]
MSGHIAINGAGLIGRAWAISFARGGHHVVLRDAVEGVADHTRDQIPALLTGLKEEGLLGDQDIEEVFSRISATDNIETALDGAIHVQENAPERLDVKIMVFKELDEVAAPETVLASSSSALLPSAFTEELKHRERCLVAHPINPPYLVPAVEVVPAPWTDPQKAEQTAKLLESVGHKPLRMQKEIDGFIMNRLQVALLHEAFRLVDQGYASVEDIDVGIADGLGLRWAFIGPFETIDLNAPGGVRDYVNRYNGLATTIGSQQTEMADWKGTVLDRIEQERRGKLADTDLGKRQIWRDRHLMALAAHKRRSQNSLGE